MVYCNICGEKFRGENPAACPNCKKEIQTLNFQERLVRARRTTVKPLDVSDKLVKYSLDGAWLENVGVKAQYASS